MKKLKDFAEKIAEEKGNVFEEAFPDVKEITKDELKDKTFIILDVKYNESSTYEGLLFATILLEYKKEKRQLSTSAKAIVEDLKIIGEEEIKKGVEATMKKIKSKSSTYSYWIIE